ncbi:hypothetical protein OG21DRAFT_790774 [Imleria badia]|nr:hypothetical protein OG21DRAFT_790774 [Imleria badia]
MSFRSAQSGMLHLRRSLSLCGPLRDKARQRVNPSRRIDLIIIIVSATDDEDFFHRPRAFVQTVSIPRYTSHMPLPAENTSTPRRSQVKQEDDSPHAMSTPIPADAFNPFQPHPPSLYRRYEKRLAHLATPCRISSSETSTVSRGSTSLASTSQAKRRLNAAIGRYPRTRGRRARNRQSW